MRLTQDEIEQRYGSTAAEYAEGLPLLERERLRMTFSDWIDKIIKTRTETQSDSGASERMDRRGRAAKKLYEQQVQHVLEITPVSGDDIAIARRIR